MPPRVTLYPARLDIAAARHRTRATVSHSLASPDDGARTVSPYAFGPDDTLAVEVGTKRETLARVILPAAAAVALGIIAYPILSILFKTFLDAGELAILGNDSSQFMQNLLTVNGLLFSILLGNSYYFMYQQTETLYMALYAGNNKH